MNYAEIIDQGPSLSELLYPAFKRYEQALKSRTTTSSEISEEVSAIAQTNEESVADLLQQAVPFCKKVKELKELKQEHFEELSQINSERTYKIIELFCEIIEEYWDILSEHEKESIKSKFSALNASINNQDTPANWLKAIWYVVRKKGVIKDILNTSKIRAILYLYIACRYFYIAKYIIFKDEGISYPFQSFFEKSNYWLRVKNIKSNFSNNEIIQIVGNYLALKEPDVVVSKHASLKSASSLYAILAYYYINKEEIDGEIIYISPDSAEGKAIQRLEAIESGEEIDWITDVKQGKFTDEADLDRWLAEHGYL